MRFVKRIFKSLLLYGVLPAVYRWHSRRPVEPRKCIFADARSAHMPESMRLMHEKCADEGLDVRCFFMDFASCGPLRLMSHILRFVRQYATAQTVFICDFYLPVYGCKKRNETVVVQLWHGCGAFKRFGHSTADDIPPYLASRAHTNYSLVPVSSPAVIPHYAEALRAGPDIVRALGVSRTDVLFDLPVMERKRAQFLDRAKIKGKGMLLYAPSFRGDASSPSPFPMPDFTWLYRELGAEYALAVKLHPLMQKKYPLSDETKKYMIDCGGEDILTLLAAADILVTDYSSVIFECALLKKPMLFFAPDAGQYENTRGFYIDYARGLPGPIVKTTQQLIGAVQSIGRYDYERLDAFARTYMSSCDGHATDRIFNEVKRLCSV